MIKKPYIYFYALFISSAYAHITDDTKVVVTTPEFTKSFTNHFEMEQICCTWYEGKYIAHYNTPLSDPLPANLLVKGRYELQIDATSTNQSYHCHGSDEINDWRKEKNLTQCRLPAKEEFDAYNAVVDSSLTVSFSIENPTSQPIKIDNAYIGHIYILGSGGYDIVINAVIPAKSSCSISTASSINIGSISASQLMGIAPGTNISGKEKEAIVNVDCNGGLYSLKLETDRPDGKCVGTDNNTLAYCIDGYDMSTGQSQNSNPSAEKSQSLIIRPARGKGSIVPGKSTGVLRVTVSPQ